MKCSIIGCSEIGANFARLFAQRGVAVSIADTSGTDDLATLAAELGGTITAVPTHVALKADILILAVPFHTLQPAIGEMINWTGKIIVDATSSSGLSRGERYRHGFNNEITVTFPGATLVKTLNEVPTKTLAKNPAEKRVCRVMFLSSEDQASGATVAELFTTLGFASLHLVDYAKFH